MDEKDRKVSHAECGAERFNVWHEKDRRVKKQPIGGEDAKPLQSQGYILRALQTHEMPSNTLKMRYLILDAGFSKSCHPITCSMPVMPLCPTCDRTHTTREGPLVR